MRNCFLNLGRRLGHGHPPERRLHQSLALSQVHFLSSRGRGDHLVLATDQPVAARSDSGKKIEILFALACTLSLYSSIRRQRMLYFKGYQGV